VTRKFTAQQTQSIIQTAVYRFDCFDYVGAANWKKKDRDERNRKRQSVESLVLRGVDLLNSDNPPRTREEAIRQISQVPPFVRFLMLILGTAFPQYALAISVAEWLWDMFIAGDDSVVVTAGNK
jgi:hypothetical protein